MKNARTPVLVVAVLLFIFSAILFFVVYDDFSGYILLFVFMMVAGSIGEICFFASLGIESKKWWLRLSLGMPIALGFWLLFGHFGMDRFYFLLPIVLAAWGAVSAALRIVAGDHMEKQRFVGYRTFYVLGIVGMALALALLFNSSISAVALSKIIVLVFVLEGVSNIYYARTLVLGLG